MCEGTHHPNRMVRWRSGEELDIRKGRPAVDPTSSPLSLSVLTPTRFGDAVRFLGSSIGAILPRGGPGFRKISLPVFPKSLVVYSGRVFWDRPALSLPKQKIWVKIILRLQRSRFRCGVDKAVIYLLPSVAGASGHRDVVAMIDRTLVVDRRQKAVPQRRSAIDMCG